MRVVEFLNGLSDGQAGLDGKSAYEIAIEHGFVGTAQDWLDSLKGDPGDRGESGKSAYEIAVENGFSGTEQDWLDSLKGDKGDSGTADYTQNSRADIAIQIADRIYPGTDLSVKFASEISGYSSVWAWIKARIQAANFTDIHVGDYIPFTLTDGKAFKAEIAGIDTYYRYGDPAVGHHIDFITRDCHPDTRQWNKVNYNNGTSVSFCPWLACDLYAWLNSKAMNVPNATTANPSLVAVNYTTTGIFAKLPADLSSVIVEKRAIIPTRYTAGALLIDDNSWAWANVGKLWLPFEVEVYGSGMWGSVTPANPGFSTGGFVQYPIFSQNMKCIKGAGDGGSNSHWWLASGGGGTSTIVARVSGSGAADHYTAGDPGVRAPLCFRIA